MATRYAVATGNWSNTATWDGGTLPTSADDVYANNKTVTIDQNITVVSLRNAAVASPVIAAGGSFQTQTSGTRTISANVISTGATILNVQGTCNCTLTGNVTGGSSGSNYPAVIIANYGSLGSSLSSYPVFVLNGNVTGGSVSGAYGVRLWGGTMTINGAVTGGTASTGANGADFYNSDNQPAAITINTGPITGGSSSSGSTPGFSATTSPTGTALTNSYININCNIVGGSIQQSNYGVSTSSSIPITIVGNITPAFGTGLYHNANANLAVTGNINCSGQAGAGIQSVGGVSSNVITVNGNITAGTSGATGGFFKNGGLGNVSITGTVTGGTAQQASGVRIDNNANGTVTINGDVYGTSAGGYGARLFVSSGSTIVVNGNSYGSTTGTSGYGVSNETIYTVTVNGNSYGGGGTGCYGAYNGSTGTLIVNGSAVAGTGTTCSGAHNNSTGTMIVTKAVGNGYGPGSVGIGISYGVVSNNQGSITRVEQLEFGALGMIPIFGPGQIVLVSQTTNIVNFYTSTGTRKTLVDGNASGLMPAVSNVRSGISYNGGSLTGTCAVPAASSVAAGVAVDNTVGTAALTQANVWGYALSSASSVAGSVGEKLKKTAIPADIIALG